MVGGPTSPSLIVALADLTGRWTHPLEVVSGDLTGSYMAFQPFQPSPTLDGSSN
ncbi:hypothetical protein M404DRAFT_20434 [Pisolithus tinctorius Marx 270]|uniref:Uncharacterized protein n=1 Tax=Pisolithus tinctorius Marx 270 TaxID=870435 RepID=A0A0C3PT25_PISTI|nr:hypothetical protein M404DRAFT_20434 [Pisolithus tinctorius Marx 270]